LQQRSVTYQGAVIADKRTVDSLADNEEDNEVERTELADMLLADESQQQKQNKVNHRCTNDEFADTDGEIEHCFASDYATVEPSLQEKARRPAINASTAGYRSQHRLLRFVLFQARFNGTGPMSPALA
jgi:hypothetical protein